MPLPRIESAEQWSASLTTQQLHALRDAGVAYVMRMIEDKKIVLAPDGEHLHELSQLLILQRFNEFRLICAAAGVELSCTIVGRFRDGGLHLAWVPQVAAFL